MDIPNDKFFALDNEIRTSIKLIELGLGELQNLSMGNDFYHLPFQLLSSGFERLFKSILCINFFVENEKFPDLKYLKNGGNGHDILNLKDLFLKDLFIAKVPATNPHFSQGFMEYCNIFMMRIILCQFSVVKNYYRVLYTTKFAHQRR